LDNVRKYREDICEALNVELLQDDLVTEFFLGRFTEQQWELLDSLGLINRGFCPICGREPISNQYYRSNRYSKVKQHLCEDCYTRTNLDVSDLERIYPGYRRRYYTIKLIKWSFILGILYFIINTTTDILRNLSLLSIALFILSILIFLYWYFLGASKVSSARPLILRRYPGMVLLLALVLAISGWLSR